MSEAVLYIVATPIGNIDDITYRAVKVLREVDLIAAEDTRRAGQLLSRIDIKGKELVSYYDQVEQERSKKIIERMVRHEISVALISDAGTPCVSDPGFRLVAAAHAANIRVSPLPGACAMTALVSASGLPTDRFTFVGFLPQKDKALRTELSLWESLASPIVFYESTRRFKKTLNIIRQCHPDARICVGRELTKLYEEITQMDLNAALDWADEHTHLKGELVAMIDNLGRHESLDQEEHVGELEALLLNDFKAGKRFKEILRERKDCGLARGDLYQLLMKVKSKYREKG